MILDLTSLRAFVAVVELGSFASAAGRVHRSQPAITQRIQKLEADIGKPLFSKVGRSKRLTEDGQRLFEYAQQILSLHDEACESLSNSPLRGEIRLGAPDDVTDTILPHLLQRFAALYPHVRITIHIARSAFLMQAMKQGDIDLAISTSDDPSFPRLILRTVPTVWIGAAEYRLERDQPLPLILHDEPSLFRKLAIDSLERARIPYTVRFISPSLAGIRAAIRGGVGITARSVEMLDSRFRVLVDATRLPELPSIHFYLYLSSLNANPVARQMFEKVDR